MVFKIHEVTGEKISTTTIWKLRNGQLTNPQLRVIEALAKTFGVPAGFFLEDYDEGKLGLWREQVELLALIRDSGITAAQFKTILGLDDEGRRVVAASSGALSGPASRHLAAARALNPRPAEVAGFSPGCLRGVMGGPRAAPGAAGARRARAAGAAACRAFARDTSTGNDSLPSAAAPGVRASWPGELAARDEPASPGRRGP